MFCICAERTCSRSGSLHLKADSQKQHPSVDASSLFHHLFSWLSFPVYPGILLPVVRRMMGSAPEWRIRLGVLLTTSSPPPLPTPSICGWKQAGVVSMTTALILTFLSLGINAGWTSLIQQWCCGELTKLRLGGGVELGCSKRRKNTVIW